MGQVVRASILGLLALSFSAPSAVAQTETAQVSGTVRDPTGAIVPGAKVALKSAGTAFTRTTTASDNGLYTFTSILPGSYDMSVEAEGFSIAAKHMTLSAGEKAGVDFTLELGQTNTIVEVKEKTSAAVNTQTQTLGTLVTAKEIVDLPTLTRNPYDLVRTAGNVSEADPSTQAGAPRGAGVAINGLRSASTNVMLDGVNNNDEFTASIGQAIPLDAVQEFTVLTSNFTSEFGRASGGIVNAVTKSGTNSYHGTLYEFNRNSKIASNSFDNNSNRISRPIFNRNQFGYSAGGPIIPNKLFIFSSTEWIRVRSEDTRTVFIPAPDLIAASGAGAKNFFSTFGQLRQGVISLGTFSRNDLRAQGFDPCRGAATGGPCTSLSPTLPLFQRVAYNRPFDSGGGIPQNTYLHVTRFDYILDDKTQIYGRYALQSNNFFPGSNADSPYQGFDAGSEQFNNSALLSITRAFSPALTAQSKLSFDRLNNFQPLGQRPPVPSLYFLGNQTTSILGTNVALPGYLPFTPANGLPFGGPQNFLQVQEDVSYVRGAHQFRFGGTYTYLRDNRTFGAFEEGVETLGTNFGAGLDNLLRGQLFQFQGAIDPQGKFPCGAAVTPGCTIQLPAGPPDFTRSNRFHDFGFYGQDMWRVSRRVTVNLGLRWEYFGVQHNNNPRLDSNFFFPRDTSRFQAIRNGDVTIAEDSSVGGLYRKDWNNFAPRIGFAWDIFGDGKSSLRGGYGIGYERNFGNVTFNTIQNPPNYAVLSLVSGVDSPAIPITTNNAGPLAGTSGVKALPRVSLRAVDPNLRTAYAHVWSASLEREVFPNIVAAVEYSGSRGQDLYSIENVNRVGSGNVFFGDPCTPGSTPGDPGGCLSRLRNTQYTNINFRANNGFSYYHALNVRTDIKNAFHSGVSLRANYTWSHAIDNLSSTFSEAANNLNLGVLDPFNKRLDRGNADFDMRHRVTISGIWDIPVERFTSHTDGILGYVLKGWTVASILTASSGSPYSLFDCSNAFAVCPRAAFDGPVPRKGPSDPPAIAGQPNRFDFLDLQQYRPNSTFVNPIVNISDFGPFPKNMTGRNAFRGPGQWNVDAALYKTTRLTERFSLQLRGEAFNIANHANLKLIGSGNDVSSINLVSAQRDGRRNVQVGAKLIF